MKFLGKLPARHDPNVPTLHRLMSGVRLPPVPDIVAWNTKVSGYGMLGNDQMGDCVVAWALHQVQTWSANANIEIVPALGDALSIYIADAGYDPATGANDNGLNVDDFLQSWMTNGIPINQLNPAIKLIGYGRLDPADIQTIKSCIYWFGSVTCGANLPGDAETEFDAGKPWASVSGQPIGGHCFGFVGYDLDYLYAVTWGDGTKKVQPVTHDWWLKYADEADVLISQQWIKSSKTPSGVDLPQMESELTTLRGSLNLAKV